MVFKYCTPVFYITNSFQTKNIDSTQKDFLFDIFNSKNTSEDFNEVYTKEKIFVFGDPGVGKTRFLKEVVIQANNNSYNALYIDLIII
jgi:predicted NACHT family NTPase